MSNMEDILTNQQQISKAIEHTYSNFKKDSPDRKTPEYLQRRLDILDNYWLEFENNHRKLLEFGDESHSYFTSDEHSRVKERYESIRSHIQNYLPTAADRPPVLKPPTFTVQKTELQQPSVSLSQQPPTATCATASKTEEMLKKQCSNFKAFQRTITSINLESVSEKWEFEDLLRTLQARWTTIDALHWDLDSELEGRNQEYDQAYNSYEQAFNKMKKSINKKMWSVKHIEKSVPSLEIPTFHGSYKDFVSFKDLFTESIHNNPSMSPAQKMQYLKSRVKGDAERLIQHLNVSSDNYSVCWEILNQRYNNKKLIFTSHINLLLNLPVMQQQSLTNIKRMLDTTMESLNAIKNLGVNISTWDPLVVHILSQKLDMESYTDYIESVKQPRELPILQEFLDFLEAKFTTLETARRKQDNSTHKYQGNKQQNTNIQANQKPNFIKHSFSSSAKPIKPSNITTTYKCNLCKNNDHGIYYCHKFLDMTSFDRRKFLSKFNMCSNCLKTHQGKCLSENRCRECNKEHNSLLHDAFAQSSRATSDTAAASTNEGASSSGNSNSTPGKFMKRSSHVSLPGEPSEVLLPTAIIKVQGVDGNYHTMRVLLDQGSQASLITENAAQILGLPRKSCKGVVAGIGDNECNLKGMITIKCSSVINDYAFITDVLIMNQLIKKLPMNSFSKPDWPYLNQIKLADPDFNLSRPIDILLGADVYAIILLDGICRETSTLTTAQQTRLGWILSGNIQTFQCNVVLNNIDEISKFWESEDISEPSEMSSEDQRCLDFYRSTTKRREDGRYEVRLPMKPNFQDNLGSSKGKAIAQFYKLEQNLNRRPDISQQYKSFIKEYLELGHMIPALHSNTTPQCYLPHHSVTRQDSTTTKLRVVFNASSKTSSSSSLNCLMSTGPNLQQDLQSLIIKWRQFKFAFTSDLEKFYRQIWLHPDDQQLHLIIWRDNPSEKLQVYQLATVTYGTKAAPFLAMQTLKQLAQDESRNYQHSLAPRVLEESFYMDDLVHGAHSVESGKQLQSDLINLLKSGGFNLRKWKSNSSELLQSVSVDPTTQNNFNFKHEESPKTLGISWNPQSDSFTFQSKFDTSLSRPTKRTLLSDIAKLYDPLGWLTPITTKLKILFQELWKYKLQWDEPVPDEIYQEWVRIKSDIKAINDYNIPRWIGTHEIDTIELHGFSDSSTKSLACVVYCKITRSDSVSISLVAGKSKLVPVKSNQNNKTTSPTLPRLELCAAVLLSKLMAKITNCLQNYDIKIYGWTDSMAVLGWLQGAADRWKPFVANRVKQVTESMPSSCWRYVKSKANPADCASRGLTASQLKEHTLWWEGPSWLKEEISSNDLGQISKEITDQEAKTSKQSYHAAKLFSKSEKSIVSELLTEYSSLSKITKILAWIRRFIYRRNKSTFLSIQEIKEAKSIIIKQVQQEYFGEEIEALKLSKHINSKSKIYDLNPILDEQGILRVGGRLKHANIDYEMKHPAIIPKDTKIADLIIDEAHELCFHGGPRLTTATMRRKYWLIGGIRGTKKRLRLCVKCRRHSPDLQSQLMADLPSARINPSSRAFFHTGCDFTGYVHVKANKGRGIKTTKGYVAVFVCMATKAVHLEIVSDLTISAFLAALRRMSARRGVPGHIYCDQGSNFVGANRILQQEYKEIYAILNEEFMAEVASMEIKFHLNCPSFPSAGGLWESGVKSLKHHLKRVVGEQNLTFEEYTTLLCQLEACLNSRPLCPMTEDPSDLDILTPSHFLGSGPFLNIYETETDMRTRWHLTQKLFKDIWGRWRNEYLTQLAARSKWRKPQRNIQENDVVIIRDDNLPPGKWALGRVVKLHPGSDGYVRVVTLKTKNGLMQRPIVKLSILPVYPEQENTENQDTSNHQVPSKPREQENVPKTKRKRFCLSSIATSLLFFFMTIMPTSQGALYNITPLNNRTLYFDSIAEMHLIQDDWRLVVYYDTLPYEQGTMTLTKYISYLDKLCNNIKEQSLCEGIVLQMQHELPELQYYNNILLHHEPHSRRRHRRGLINGVGYLANSLFGVLDQHFADKYEEDISLIRKNEQHLASLWKNQTSIVEAELNFLKRMEGVIDKHNKLIDEKVQTIDDAVIQIKESVQNISIISEFLSTSIMANNLLYNLKNIQQTLLTTVTNIYNGKFNLHLLTPQQLRQELNIIAGQLPKDLSLPVDSNIFSKIYNLLEVRTKVTIRYIIFEIKIPLTSRDEFEVLKLIPIPYLTSRTNQTIITPIAEYVAINLKKDAFVPLTERDLDSCLRRDPESLLCRLKTPIYHLKDDQNLCKRLPNSDKCETITTSCNNKWKELYKINSYVYSCCDQCQLKLLCGDQVTAVQIYHSGLFNVGQGCIIKSADFLVYTHKQDDSKLRISSDIRSPQISPINHYINISLPDLTSPNNDSNNINDLQLQNIQKQLEEIKQETPLVESVSYHDVHHYVAIYVLFVVITAGLLMFVWRRYRRRSAPAAAQPASAAEAGPQPASTSSASVQCLQSDMGNQCNIELSEIPSARVSKQNKNTSPVLRSVFPIPNL